MAYFPTPFTGENKTVLFLNDGTGSKLRSPEIWKPQAPNRAIPKYVIFDTSSIIAEFRHRCNLSERDLCELLVQIFDELQYTLTPNGPERDKSSKIFQHRPNYNLLVGKPLLVERAGGLTAAGAEVRQAYDWAYAELERFILENMREVIRADNGEFNYTFREMRADCALIRHLSDSNEGVY